MSKVNKLVKKVKKLVEVMGEITKLEGRLSVLYESFKDLMGEPSKKVRKAKSSGKGFKKIYTPADDLMIHRMDTEGKSYREIAQALGRTEKGIGQRLIKIRKTFVNTPLTTNA